MSDFVGLVERVSAERFPALLRHEDRLLMDRVSREEFYAAAGPHMKTMFSMNLDTYDSLSRLQVDQAQLDASQFLREHFQTLHSEHFLVRGESGLVGWATGEMLDDETFYCRNGAVLPAFQRQGVMQLLFEQVVSYLRTLGYLRLVLRHLTTNRNMAIFIISQGFNITGVSTDERWGTNVETTLSLDPIRLSLLEREFGNLPSRSDLPVRSIFDRDAIVYPKVHIDDLDSCGALGRPATVSVSGCKHTCVYVRPFDRNAILRLLGASFLATGYTRRPNDGCWVEMTRTL